MNILIPHSWLLEHLETTATPSQIQTYLSLCGPSVEHVYQREGDAVYDIEVTTNRVDSMSVRGIAREAAVILSQNQLPSRLLPLKHLSLPQPESDQLPLPAIITNTDVCQRVLCIALSQVKQTETPEWMARRLRQIDQNVHGSVIDITNYVTHELGHPCHAFDYDKVMGLGGQIRITEALPGKTFVTLDGVEYQTVGGEVVFENQSGEIIDLPAIKGTLNTAIDANTHNVLFWIESIESSKVRFSSMSHAIRTVAAQLNEKHVDPHLGKPVLLEAVKHYQDLCGAHIASSLHDEFPHQKESVTIAVPYSAITSYLGLELEPVIITTILENLECAVSTQKTTDDDSQNPVGEGLGKNHNLTFLVTPPTYRPDLAIPADIVEEIARIYGYHQLPSVLMPTRIPLERPTDVDFAVENRIKHFLADQGWQEVYTYSMVSELLAQESGWSVEDHLRLQNPLTDDRIYLRRSLLPSLVEIIVDNPQQKNLSVFELATTYQPQVDNLPSQLLSLGIVSPLSYRELRGVVEALLRQFFIAESWISADGVIFAPLHSTQSASSPATTAKAKNTIKDESVELGRVRQLSSDLLGVEILLPALLRVARKHPEYQPIPKTTPIIEDLTFTLPEATSIGEVVNTIRRHSPLIQQVKLQSIYQRNYSFTLHYLDRQRNLTQDDVGPLRQAIIDRVVKEHHAQLVGANASPTV